ncbi:MAG: RraA family protein [Sedimentibacter sp.]|uniref:RraA family protein n=1 Tax=Sedimentibacter sp. TaxID=1960295 RepID=UPI003158BA56
MELTQEIIDRFMKVDPAQVGHYVKSGYMSPKIKPIYKAAKIVGPAYTVRIPGKDSTALYYAMKRAPKGSVIVIDRAGDDLYACTGEIVATVAKRLGLAGIVIDGPATDSIAIENMQFPVFCDGLSPVTTNLLGISGEYDVTVQCGGAVVNPGDIIFGDADGVIVIPPDNYEELLEKAEEATRAEFKTKKLIEETGFVSTNVDRLFETDVLAIIAELKKFD